MNMFRSTIILSENTVIHGEISMISSVLGPPSKASSTTTTTTRTNTSLHRDLENGTILIWFVLAPRPPQTFLLLWKLLDAGYGLPKPEDLWFWTEAVTAFQKCASVQHLKRCNVSDNCWQYGNNSGSSESTDVHLVYLVFTTDHVQWLETDCTGFSRNFIKQTCNWHWPGSSWDYGTTGCQC